MHVNLFKKDYILLHNEALRYRAKHIAVADASVRENSERIRVANYQQEKLHPRSDCLGV